MKYENLRKSFIYSFIIFLKYHEPKFDEYNNEIRLII
jgi:hypothetical protein